MIDFDAARRIAERAVGRLPRGTTYAATTGWETGKEYVVNVGPEEWLIDRDDDFKMTDTPLVRVNKQDGSYIVATYLDDPDAFDRMKEVASA